MCVTLEDWELRSAEIIRRRLREDCSCGDASNARLDQYWVGLVAADLLESRWEKPPWLSGSMGYFLFSTLDYPSGFSWKWFSPGFPFLGDRSIRRFESKYPRSAQSLQISCQAKSLFAAEYNHHHFEENKGAVWLFPIAATLCLQCNKCYIDFETVSCCAISVIKWEWWFHLWKPPAKTGFLLTTSEQWWSKATVALREMMKSPED